MINSLIKIPDNVITSFEVVDGNFILGAPEPTYQGLDQTCIGYHVPYFAKNILLGVNGPAYEWEVGIGKVLTTTVIDRIKVIKSSSNIGVDGFVQFTFGGTKTFAIYQNEYNTNIAFNNVVTATGSFNISNIRSTILVDLAQNNSYAYLPAASGNDGLVIDFKSYNQNLDNVLTISPSGSDTIDGSSELLISENNVYTSLISTGSGWAQLKNETNVNFSIEGIGLPQGNNFSLQYKVGSGELGGSNLFAINSGLLIGSTNPSTAQHVFSSNNDNIINNKSLNVDFVVKGSGNKNLKFSSTGKLGLNIPSGYSPNSLLHLVSSNCDATLKIENRNNCIDSVPSLVFNHRPTTTVPDNSTVGRVSYTAKNSAGTTTAYSDIRSKAINSTTGYTSGQLIFSVDDTGTLSDILSLDKDKVKININDSNLIISDGSLSGNYTANLTDIYCDNLIVGSLTGISTNILYTTESGLISSLPIDINKISISGHSHQISDINELSSTISGIYTYTNNAIQNTSGLLNTQISSKIDIASPIFYTGIATSYIDSTTANGAKIDFVNENLEGDWKQNNISILSADTTNPSFSGYLLTHNGGSIEWKQFNPYNYIFDGIDIQWKKYLNKNCNILSGGIYVNVAESDITTEFSLQDTIKVSISGTNYLRTISEITSQSTYTTISLNESVPVVGSGTIFSISKGGYLELSVDPVTAPGVSPKNIISSRPFQDTIFNSTSANLGFRVYSNNANPIINVLSSGNMVINGSNPRGSGTALTVNGSLYANNFQLGEVAVPSGYILTSTNNNVAVWTSPTSINDLDAGIIVFTGVGVL
jgi:hypothetical protein